MESMLNKGSTCIMIAGLLLAGVRSSPAQSKTAISSIDSVAVFEAIPNDVAFQLLNLPGNAIEQPGTVSEFLASIQPVLDSQGSISPGMAVSVAPYQMIMGDRLQLADYVKDPFVRILSNTEVSLGSAPSQNADSSQDWGIGLRINLLNTGDGRLDTNHINDLVASSTELFNATPMLTPGGTITPQYISLIQEANGLIAGVKNALHPGPGESADFESAGRYLDTLSAIADGLDTLKLGSGTASKDAIALREFVRNTRNLIEYMKTDSALKQAGATKAWNTTSLDIEGGLVYRASRSRVAESAFNRYRVWINGGIGLGSSQLLAQVGVYHQTANGSGKDSTSAVTALMYRLGNESLRFGVGGNGYDFKKGALNLVAEIKVGRAVWLVASFNREVEKGISPTWSPSISIKTTGGAFGL